MKRRSKLILWGGALAAALSMGGHPASAGNQATPASYAATWILKIWVRLRAEPCKDLALCIRQQAMSRLTLSEEIAARRVSIFAPTCTLKELRDGLKAQFGYRMEAVEAGESIHFHLSPGVPPAVSPAKGGRPTASTLSGVADPGLQEKLDLSTVEVEDEEGGFPQILQCLSEAASIPIMADYTPRADTCPKGLTVSQYLSGLNGLTLGEAIDRTARAFKYTCTRSGRWFLFRSR